MTKETEEQPGTGGEETGRSSRPSGGPESKKGIEDRLDDMADRFSRAMTEGAKRLEDAFDKGMKTFRESDRGSGRVKGFFSSSHGGAFLIVVGAVWFFYTIGLFKQPIFPLLMIAIGAYLMYRYREKGEGGE